MRVQSIRRALKNMIDDASCKGTGTINLYYGERDYTILSLQNSNWNIFFYKKGKNVKKRMCDESNMLYMLDLFHIQEINSLYYEGQVYKKGL